MVSECPLVKNRGGTVLREDWKPHPLAEDIAHWAKPLADKIRASCWAGRSVRRPSRAWGGTKAMGPAREEHAGNAADAPAADKL
jgi:hypothetical protein